MDCATQAITILDLAFRISSQIYTYTKDVKEARRDIDALSNELFALIGVIERLRHSDGHGDANINTLPRLHSQPGFLRVMNETLEFLQNLHATLETPRGRLDKALQKMKWPLKGEETKRHLERLERVKTYFLLSIMTNDLEQTKNIAKQIESLRSEMAERENEVQRLNKRRMIFEWLCPIDPRQVRQQTTKTRVPGSGAWFTKEDKFCQWAEADSSTFFWLNGITGAGKTTLMTTAMESLLPPARSQGSVVFFYCSFNDTHSQSPQNILGSILSQLYQESEESDLSELEKAYEDQSRNTNRPSQIPEQRLFDLILKKTQTKMETFIFIDGLNECAEPSVVLSWLKTLVNTTRRVHIFLSSINEKGIEDELRDVKSLTIDTLETTRIGGDIILLIYASLEAHPRLKMHSAALREEIAEALMTGAQGMFRWVQCQLDRLGKLRTPGAIIEALKMLPNTLNKTYEEHLLRIDSDEDKPLARDILTLLSISLKPLTLKEICEALQITLQMPHRDNSRQLPNHTDILSICGSLLSYDHSHKTVALAHHSVQAYLTSDHLEGPVAYYRVDKIAAHGQWATKCLTYLMYDKFSSGPCSDFEQRCADYPFFLYAAHNWALHMQNLGDHLDSNLLALLTPFLQLQTRHQQPCPNFAAWLQALLPSATYAWDTPPLYYAASFGLLPIVKVLLDNGADGEARGGRCGSTVLGIAILRKHHEVVRMLLNYGVDPWKAVECDFNAFEWAMALGDLATTEVLRMWLKVTPEGRSSIVGDAQRLLLVESFMKFEAEGPNCIWRDHVVNALYWNWSTVSRADFNMTLLRM